MVTKGAQSVRSAGPGVVVRDGQRQVSIASARRVARLPASRPTEYWDANTPDGFVLSAKFPRSVVHGGEIEKPDPTRIFDKADTDRFLGVMSELGAKCRPLVLQFPYFGQTAFRTLRAFLDRLEPFLASLPSTFRYGVEVRNKTRLTSELTDALRAHRVARSS